MQKELTLNDWLQIVHERIREYMHKTPAHRVEDLEYIIVHPETKYNILKTFDSMTMHQSQVYNEIKLRGLKIIVDLDMKENDLKVK